MISRSLLQLVTRLMVGMSLGLSLVLAARAANALRPDIVVAADGTGDFSSLHAAVQSIPRHNRERTVIFVKNGLYRERVRVDAAHITIRGESRDGTRLEFSHSASEPIDELGRSVLELSATANDFVLENMTVENTHGVIGVHAFAILGRADRVIIQDCDILSQGNDTLAMWRGRLENAAEVDPSIAASATPVLRDGGRYYHARLRVVGSVDFICPRGWCYLTESSIKQLNPRADAAIWHDGRHDADKKFVVTKTRFDGPPGWGLARHHHDAQFFLLNCTFSETMRDRAPYRVIYPQGGGTPTKADLQRNRDYDRTNQWGERAYFHDSHREGGDYPWHRNNLPTGLGIPKPEEITAAWTFAGTWDPERSAGPVVRSVARSEGGIAVTFSEPITVKGKPRLELRGGRFADYASGSGGDMLVFSTVEVDASNAIRLDLNGGAILASEAATTLRAANLPLPGLFPAMATESKIRVFVLTDIENEPDDAQSLARFLVYPNELYTPPSHRRLLEPETRPFWTDAVDEVIGVDGKWHSSNKATIWRWRSASQHDFAAHMDWTIKPDAEANHPPIARLAHPAVLYAKPGARVDRSALPRHDVSCELITLPGAPHALRTWAEYDPPYPDRMIAWLHAALASRRS